VLLISVLTLLAITPTTRAGDENKVEVTVLAILATDKNKNVDPQLKPVAHKVQKIEPSLTGFKLRDTVRRSIDVGKASKFMLLEDGVPCTITVEQGPNKENRVGLTVKPPQLGEICYLSCCGKFFPIVTRYQTKDKQRLIIAIMVEPCNKKCD
jgi:hypothetical protein